MATRSALIVKSGKAGRTSTYKISYINYDGYLDGVGSHLITYWNTPQKALELVEFGDCRGVGKDKASCEPYNEFFKPQNITLEDAVKIAWQTWSVDYIYLFDGKDWKYTEDGKTFRKIPKKFIKKEAITEGYYGRRAYPNRRSEMHEGYYDRDYETLEELIHKESRDYYY